MGRKPEDHERTPKRKSAEEDEDDDRHEENETQTKATNDDLQESSDSESTRRKGDNADTGNNSGHTGNSPDSKTNKSKKTGNEKTNSRDSRQQTHATSKSEQSSKKTAAKSGNTGTKAKEPVKSKQNSDKAAIKTDDKEQKASTKKEGETKSRKAAKDKEAIKRSQTKDNDNEMGGSERDQSKNNSKQKDGEEGDVDPMEDAEKLHNAMKGFGTDEKVIIDIVTARKLSQRQDIRQAYTDKYKEDLLTELDSELSGDFRNLLLDLMRLPWERELQALINSMSGLGTNETLLVHVLLTHDAMSTSELSQKFKDAEKKDLTKAVESETSGNLRHFLQGLLKGRLNGQKPDKRTAEDIAVKLHNGGKPLLQTKPMDAIDMLTSVPAEKMADMTSHYQKLSGRSLQEDIRKHSSGDAEDALIAFVSHASDPEIYQDDMVHRSLEGEITFSIFSLIVSNKEDELQKVQERYESSRGRTLQSAVEKELKGDVRTLVLQMLARAASEEKEEKTH